MPRAFLADKHHTISINANDLLTITYTRHARTSIVNKGPGVLWVSYKSTVPANVGDENCLSLTANMGYDTDSWEFGRNNTVTIMADLASGLTFTVG